MKYIISIEIGIRIEPSPADGPPTTKHLRPAELRTCYGRATIFSKEESTKMIVVLQLLLL